MQRVFDGVDTLYRRKKDDQKQLLGESIVLQESVSDFDFRFELNFERGKDDFFDEATEKASDVNLGKSSTHSSPSKTAGTKKVDPLAPHSSHSVERRRGKTPGRSRSHVLRRPRRDRSSLGRRKSGPIIGRRVSMTNSGTGDLEQMAREARGCEQAELPAVAWSREKEATTSDSALKREDIDKAGKKSTTGDNCDLKSEGIRHSKDITTRRSSRRASEKSEPRSARRSVSRSRKSTLHRKEYHRRHSHSDYDDKPSSEKNNHRHQDNASSKERRRSMSTERRQRSASKSRRRSSRASGAPADKTVHRRDQTAAQQAVCIHQLVRQQ